MVPIATFPLLPSSADVAADMTSAWCRRQTLSSRGACGRIGCYRIASYCELTRRQFATAPSVDKGHRSAYSTRVDTPAACALRGW
jgi:hypothetical protein